MQALDPAKDTDAKTPGVGALLLVTSLGAMDGTLVLLSANGVLSTWSGAVGVGLNVIAGAGAWVAARQAYAGRRRTRHDHLVLAAIALSTSLATVAAAWIGDRLGAGAGLLVLPRVAGLVLLLIALEVGGLRLPRLPALRTVPLPVVFALAGLVAEGVAQWTL